MSGDGPHGNPWQEGRFDVRRETRRNAFRRSKLLEQSDRVLFQDDPARTPKRERDQGMVQALATTPTAKTTPAPRRGGSWKGSDHSNAESGRVRLDGADRLRRTSGSGHERDGEYSSRRSSRRSDNSVVESHSPARTREHGRVDVGFRRVVHEMYGENTRELERRMTEIGAEPTPKSKKKWGTPLSKRDVEGMTIEDLDGHHKRLQVQTNLEYAVGMSRGAAGGRRAVLQLVEEDKKRAAKKAARATWLEHRRRLKQVNMGIATSSSSRSTGGGSESGTSKVESSKEKKTSAGSASEDMSRADRRSSRSNKTREPITMLGADASKPVYGIRRVPDVDEMIANIRRSNGNGSSTMKPSEVVMRCAEIRQNSAEDLSRLQQGLDDFLRDEMEWEEKRHDLKYVLNSRFDLLKKDIDHSVSVGGADYKYDNRFMLTEEDQRVLKRMGSSVKARRRRAMQNAERVRKETLAHMSERRVDLTRQRLGLRSRKQVVTGAQLDDAAADVLRPGHAHNGNFGAFS